MSYEKYFKDVSSLKKVDVYRVLSLFGVTDHALGHAAKKILLCGVRTGGKGVEQEIKEARDTLSRWLEMREEDKVSFEWPCDDRIDVIGQNGNDGAVYESQCWCKKCNIRTIKIQDGPEKALEILSKMPLCPQCGDKRCERAKHHDNECSGNQGIHISEEQIKNLDELSAEVASMEITKTWVKPVIDVDKFCEMVRNTCVKVEEARKALSSMRKQYRDLEKPWEWQIGDYAVMEWQNHVAAGKIIEISENSYGELCFTVDSDNRPYVYSCATSVEARN